MAMHVGEALDYGYELLNDEDPIDDQIVLMASNGDAVIDEPEIEHDFDPPKIPENIIRIDYDMHEILEECRNAHSDINPYVVKIKGEWIRGSIGNGSLDPSPDVPHQAYREFHGATEPVTMKPERKKCLA